MRHELFGDRRRAPEGEFFRRPDTPPTARRSTEEERRQARAALAEASHIRDDALLDQLMSLGINADTLIALSLVPLVEVAWADGRVEDAEKRRIVEAARAGGLAETSVGYRLLETCLSKRPPKQLTKMWKEYIKSVCATLSLDEREALKTELLRQARSVVEAAGTVTGLRPEVSTKEEVSLAEIAAAFKPLTQHSSIFSHRAADSFAEPIRLPHASPPLPLGDGTNVEAVPYRATGTEEGPS